MVVAPPKHGTTSVTCGTGAGATANGHRPNCTHNASVISGIAMIAAHAAPVSSRADGPGAGDAGGESWWKCR